MKKNKFPIYFLFMLLFSSCSRFYVNQKKDISFTPNQKLKLDLYTPKKKTTAAKNVLVFVHGGNWESGSKSLYEFFGRGMARKEVITVVIDYRLYPDTTFAGMAMDVARSIKWVKDNIASYGGDPNSIYVSGHSAGGQLAALIATDDSYFDALKMKNPIKGCLLIDAFGLDMYTYLKKEEKYKYEEYRTIFTKDQLEWKRGSPIYQLHEGMPKFMLFVGGKTYPNIVEGSNSFLSELKKYQTNAQLIYVPRKRHAGMIFSFANPRKKAYKQILTFMEE